MLGELSQYNPKWFKKLEGSYVPKDWLKRDEPPEKVRPYINEGDLKLYPYGYEWVIEKFLIRERGITVTGPPPNRFIQLISNEDLRRAATKILHRDWQPMLTESNRLKDDEYQAYAVLTMCRCLFLFTNDAIASKPMAVAWAKVKFPEWKALIEAASNWSSGKELNRLNEVKDFIEFTIELAKVIQQEEQKDHTE